ATDRHRQVMRASELHAGHDIGGTCATRDQCRPPVNHSIVDRACGVVAVVAGAEECTTQAGLEGVHGGLLKSYARSCGRGASQLCHDVPPFRWCLYQIDMTPNTRPELLPEAGAQRRLEAVSCKALFGKV